MRGSGSESEEEGGMKGGRGREQNIEKSKKL